ncbi:MAG: integrase core domain-containing protein [Planctomycetota bacterium]|jgi:putative transposase
MARHSEVFLCADLFTKEVWTHRGLTTAFVFFVIYLQTPNTNAHAERFVLSVKNECLNHLLIFGLNRSQHVLDCYACYFNEHRSNQGICNKIPAKYNKTSKKWQGSYKFSNVSLKNVVRKDFLGGLLKSYQRAA